MSLLPTAEYSKEMCVELLILSVSCIIIHCSAWNFSNNEPSEKRRQLSLSRKGSYENPKKRTTSLQWMKWLVPMCPLFGSFTLLEWL